ncbi:hypothetical protein WL1483_1242 [Aeromonas schubertii]|uniref:Uncharacterized protein n=1 Tax=Aeromonas schubertii TaxID=652 RepID=A0A0S2SG22_9GAMM|nr:hypothetical protein WL1483_1242 [Aeromonas schubertii]
MAVIHIVGIKGISLKFVFVLVTMNVKFISYTKIEIILLDKNLTIVEEVILRLITIRLIDLIPSEIEGEFMWIAKICTTNQLLNMAIAVIAI